MGTWDLTYMFVFCPRRPDIVTEQCEKPKLPQTVLRTDPHASPLRLGMMPQKYASMLLGLEKDISESASAHYEASANMLTVRARSAFSFPMLLKYRWRGSKTARSVLKITQTRTPT